MSVIKCVCNYCGEFFSLVIYKYSKQEDIKCPKCNDKRIKQVKTGDIYYDEDPIVDDSFLEKEKK